MHTTIPVITGHATYNLTGATSAVQATYAKQIQIPDTDVLGEALLMPVFS